MDFKEKCTLGRTGLRAGRLGLAAGYGAPVEEIEEAFERGCNYFFWGSFRRKGMATAIRNIAKKGKRDELIVVVQCYTRLASYMEYSYSSALKRLGLDHGDVLLLGCYGSRPSARIIDRALSMKQQGLFKYLAISSHNRLLFKELAKDGIYDIFHVRYNAAHRGAESEVFPGIAEMPEDERPGLIAYTATSWGQLMKKRKMPQGEAPLKPTDCYRFALTHPAVDVAICGPKNAEQLREDLDTLELGPLEDDELVRIRKIGDHVHG